MSDVAQTARQRKIELWATFSILAAIVVYLIARQIDFYNLLPWEKTVSGAKWVKILSGHKGDVISSIVVTPDGGFAVAGSAESKGAGKKDAWVRRLDSKGKLLWSNAFGGPKMDWAKSIAVLPDGGLAVAGWSCSRCSEKPTDHRAWVVRLKKLPAKKTAK